VLALGACGGSKATTVNVTMADFSLKPEVPSVAAGTIKFEVRNNGTFGHEMVVVKAADAGDLPTKPDGEVNEDAIPESERRGEVDAGHPGFSKQSTVKIRAAKAVLF